MLSWKNKRRKEKERAPRRNKQNQLPTLAQLLQRKRRIKPPRMPKSFKRKSQVPQRRTRTKNLRKTKMRITSPTESSRRPRLLIVPNRKRKLTTLMTSLNRRRTPQPLRLNQRQQGRSNLESPSLAEVPKGLVGTSVRDLMTLMKMAGTIALANKDRLRMMLVQVEDVNSLTCLHLPKLEIITKRRRRSPSLLPSSQPSVVKPT